MKRLILLFCFGVVVSPALAQDLNDHGQFIRILTHAKDSLYTRILSKYDQHILSRPDDSKVQLERCRFIYNAYYDSYEDYNPNYEEAEQCVQELLTKFPDDPETLIYAKEYLYGDTALVYLEALNDKIEANPERWQSHSWQVYKLLAEEYHGSSNDAEAIRFGRLAVEQNDTLDISLLMGRSYKNLSQNVQAVEILMMHLDSTDEAWQINQKGRLLLELDEPQKALEAFKLAREKHADLEDSESVAQAMIDNGLLEEARSYLVKDYRETTWNVSRPLQRLLHYDLEYANADSAKTTYTRFVAENFWNDPVGLYRLKLFAKSPLLGWSFEDIGRILILLVVVIVALVIPYLWILPIHYWGWYQKEKGKVFKDSSFKWGLKHFWLVCSLWLFWSTLTYLFFDYTSFIAMFNPDIAVESFDDNSKVSADMTVFFFMGCLVFTLAFLKTEDILTFFQKLKANGQSIGIGIGLAFLLKIGLGIYIRIITDLGFDIETGVSSIASINDSILSVIKYYNPYLAFLFVVILVPFYEEVLFRGIILSACERNMTFLLANVLQSLVFAAVHQNLQYFLFYFAFGMVAGYFRNRTQSLITGTSMHMMNNLLVFIALMATR